MKVVIEKDKDGYFIASVPALRGCHTQAKTLDVLMKRVKEAIQLCFELEPTLRPRYSLDELFVQCDAAAEFSEEERAWLDSKPVGKELL